MRSFCMWVFCALLVSAQEPAIDSLGKAKAELQRLRELVAAGAIAPARLQDAEQALGDAQDETVLNRTLYGRLTAQDLTEEQSTEMIAAASRRLDREHDKLGRMQRLVDAGVIARGDLAPVEQEIESRKLALDLANSRARLLAEIAEMANREQLAEAAPVAPGEQPIMQHFDGGHGFSTKELRAIELAFEKKFAKPLPISANGETGIHKSLGFDHRGRVDVAVTPDQPEGVWLRTYLEKNEIPYYAFRAAVRGKATGAHIHIGPGSTRLRAAD